jgi:glutamine amidotransferase
MSVNTCSVLKLPNIGNIDSVAKFLQTLGLSVNIIDNNYDQKTVLSDLLILPGVGAFDKAVSALASSPIQDVLKSHIQKDLPLIGICLGFQLLCASSTENSLPESQALQGLSVFDDVNMIDLTTLDLKINVGPKILRNKFAPSIALPSEPLYFMHRYACPIDNVNYPKSLHSYVVHQGGRITSSCRHSNIWGFQFHPEKSGLSGQKFMTSILSSFR